MNYGDATDPLFDQEVNLNDMGTGNVKIRIPKDVKTGTYTLQAKIGEEYIDDQQFNIEVYQKPDIEVKVTPRQKAYIVGDEMTFDVSANYFFGSPVKNEDVTVILGGRNQSLPQTAKLMPMETPP